MSTHKYSHHSDHQPVYTLVEIGRERYEFVSVKVVQQMYEHNTCEVILDNSIFSENSATHPELGKSFLEDPLKKLELLSRVMTVGFSEDGKEYYDSKYVITSVELTAHEGKNGYILIKGSSPTVLLDAHKHYDIYSDMTLKGIFGQLTEKVYSMYLDNKTESMFPDRIDFLMQYNQTDWEFLKTLALKYGHNLYHNGYDLYFGSWKEYSVEEVNYDKDIISFELVSKIVPNQKEQHYYLAEQDLMLRQEYPSTIENSNEFLDKALTQSADFVRRDNNYPLDAPIRDISQLEEMNKRRKGRNAAESVMLKGKCKNFKPSLGRVINVKLAEGVAQTKELGTWRVVKAIHTVTEKGTYENEFEAIAGSLDLAPVPEIKLPVAGNLEAVVAHTNDPLNQGRVKVRFPFASRWESNWMRVASPNAGSSNAITQNRGFLFVPEVDDAVMVSFEQGDPSRPYISSSLYHGGNSVGGGLKNHIKSITTRSGIKIEFDDEQESLHIEDPSGNTVDLDGKGNMALNAPETIKLTCGESSLHMNRDGYISINGRTIDTSASENISQTASNNISFTSKDVLVDAMEEFKSNAKKQNWLADNDIAQNTGNNIVQNGKDKVENRSNNNTKMF